MVDDCHGRFLALTCVAAQRRRHTAARWHLLSSRARTVGPQALALAADGLCLSELFHLLGKMILVQATIDRCLLAGGDQHSLATPGRVEAHGDEVLHLFFLLI